MAQATSHIPAGQHSLGLHLGVQGAAAYIEFLKNAFDAVEISRAGGGPGGKLMHVQMQIGDSMIQFADDMCEEFHMPPLVKGNLPVAITLYVPDVDATWAKALAAGCTVRVPLADQFWGDRYGHLYDPFGFTWAIGTHKEDLTPAEIMERQAKAFGAGHP
jgi:uncharacterized glyoxalase superfamily protein PhnB